ncbi:hypothetical protein V6Z12_D08G185100 [Gossypium hirsutum]
MVDIWKCHYVWSFTYNRKRRSKFAFLILFNIEPMQLVKIEDIDTSFNVV